MQALGPVQELLVQRGSAAALYRAAAEGRLDEGSLLLAVAEAMGLRELQDPAILPPPPPPPPPRPAAAAAGLERSASSGLPTASARGPGRGTKALAAAAARQARIREALVSRFSRPACHTLDPDATQCEASAASALASLSERPESLAGTPSGALGLAAAAVEMLPEPAGGDGLGQRKHGLGGLPAGRQDGEKRQRQGSVATGQLRPLGPRPPRPPLRRSVSAPVGVAAVPQQPEAPLVLEELGLEIPALPGSAPIDSEVAVVEAEPPPQLQLFPKPCPEQPVDVEQETAAAEARQLAQRFPLDAGLQAAGTAVVFVRLQPGGALAWRMSHLCCPADSTIQDIASVSAHPSLSCRVCCSTVPVPPIVSCPQAP